MDLLTDHDHATTAGTPQIPPCSGVTRRYHYNREAEAYRYD